MPTRKAGPSTPLNLHLQRPHFKVWESPILAMPQAAAAATRSLALQEQVIILLVARYQRHSQTEMSALPQEAQRLAEVPWV